MNKPPNSALHSRRAMLNQHAENSGYPPLSGFFRRSLTLLLGGGI